LRGAAELYRTGPSVVAEVRCRLGAGRAGLALQRLEVADDPHVVELVVFAQREPGRVVAAVFEPLEALEQKFLAGSLADVSDDPAHVETSLRTRKARLLSRAPRRAWSAELSSHESGDGTTGFFGLRSGFRLGQDTHHGLGAGGPHEHPATTV